MEESHMYSKGDWIVHSLYGVGQIKGIEVKGVSGEETRYYKVKTTDSTFWMPVDQMDSEILRPLSTPEEIQRAIVALKNPPKEMSSNYKTRQSRIERVKHRKTPTAMARLIRDLRARRREKGPLNKTERSAFRALKQRLVEEWAIVAGMRTERAESRLEELLDPHQTSADDEASAAKSQETAAASSKPRQRRRWKWGTWPRRQTNKVHR